MMPFALLMVLLLTQAGGGNLSEGRAREMLRELRSTLDEHYYDATFGGVDLETRFAIGEERLKAGRSTSDYLSALALPLMDLEDSHTFFVPPARTQQVDYGVSMTVVGDDVFVTAVRPGHDAAGKVAPGDRIETINKLPANRESLPKLRYILGLLRPQPALNLRIRTPDGGGKDVPVRASANEVKRLIDLSGEIDIDQMLREDDALRYGLRNREHRIGSDILIWKMAMFTANTGEIDAMVRKARPFKALVLDLRGNGGGAVVGLQRLASHFFEKSVPLATRVGRRRKEDYATKPVREPFTGTLVVVTDSRSASASEMFARTAQLQKRGVVVGDRTAGAVMESIFVPLGTGMGRLLIFGMSVTVSDVVMPDGGRLERVGVTPDETVLPSAADLAAGRDPVLARAVAVAGGAMTAEEAGKLFPIEWKKP